MRLCQLLQKESWKHLFAWKKTSSFNYFFLSLKNASKQCNSIKKILRLRKSANPLMVQKVKKLNWKHSVWKSRKSLIQHCDLSLHFELSKVHQKMPKMVNFGKYLKTLGSNSVTRQVDFNWIKIGGKCHNWKT